MGTKNDRPVVIGLCGRSGSGKGFLSALFAEEGVPSIDTDKVYRELTGIPVGGEMSECMKALVCEFGERIVSDDKSLDRRALADIVFAPGGNDRLKRLNEITHKHILEETDRRIDILYRSGYEVVIVDAPVLFESGYDKKCDFVIASAAPEDVILKRITERDGITEKDAKRRLGVQMPTSEFIRRADHVIETDTDEDTLRSRVREAVRLAVCGKDNSKK